MTNASAVNDLSSRTRTTTKTTVSTTSRVVLTWCAAGGAGAALPPQIRFHNGGRAGPAGATAGAVATPLAPGAPGAACSAAGRGFAEGGDRSWGSAMPHRNSVGGTVLGFF